MWGKFLHGPPRIMTRDLFAVANLLVVSGIRCTTVVLSLRPWPWPWHEPCDPCLVNSRDIFLSCISKSARLRGWNVASSCVHAAAWFWLAFTPCAVAYNGRVAGEWWSQFHLSWASQSVIITVSSKIVRITTLETRHAASSSPTALCAQYT